MKARARFVAWWGMVAAASIGAACQGPAESSKKTPVVKETPAAAAAVVERTPVTISGRTFSLEVANAPKERERGLMYRKSIDPDGGMVFAFAFPTVRSFWMGWCLTDIDIIFVGANGRVTATHAMKVEPPQRPGETEEAYRARQPEYPSRLPAQFAIELAPGTLETLGVKPGDVVDADWKALGESAF